MLYSLLAVCFLLLITRSQGSPRNQPYGTRLVSRSRAGQSDLQKRATSHSGPITHYSWWHWSSTTGYQSGTSDSPPSQESGSDTISPGPTNESENYSPPSAGNANPIGEVDHAQPAAGSDEKNWLDLHNEYRRQYGAYDLKWSPDLVAASKTLTEKCVWQHTQHNKYGENMAAGQTTIKEVVDGWVKGDNERNGYQPSNPQPTHFTQVVWAQTTHVGCHMTVCEHVQGAGLPQSPVKFWGCNYNPPGNVIGEIAENVKAKAGGSPAV